MYFLNIISETKRIKRSIMLFVCRVCDLVTSQKLHNNKYQERERGCHKPVVGAYHKWHENTQFDRNFIS